MRWPGGLGILVGCWMALAAGCQPVTIERIAGGPSARAARHSERLPELPPPPMDGANPRDPAALMARAEAKCRAALAAERKERELAAGYALGAVVDASEALIASGAELGGKADGTRADQARLILNEATRLALRLSSGRRIKLDREWRDDLAAQGVRVSVARGGALWDPDRFDEFRLADDFTVRGLDLQVRSEGLGVPLIAIRRFRFGDLEGREGEEKFLMPRQVYPASAVLRVVPPSAGSTGGLPEFRLELHDPILARGVDYGSRRLPMATDFSTPLAYHFSHSALPVLQEIGLLNPQWLEKLAGLYMLHPYEPGKIPVVLVHGLRSSPASWTRVINQLQGDPKLRDRYQFWLFLYPTGTPFPASAAKLRRSLDELREAVDPAHLDPAMDRSVLIGHSMGGLISKMLVLASGAEVWKLVSARPFEELRANPERKELLRDIFFFEPHPSIRRVIFIATPHRGSELGDQFIGRLADRLIRLPGSLRSTYRAILLQNGRDFFTPEVRAGLPSSIDELRRDNRLLMSLNSLPVGRGIVIHSIIGQKDPTLPIERGSDGVVPYVSSHLDGAASELVVPGDHGCQDTPETIRELKRILLLHLGRAGAPTSADGQGGNPKR